jgi:hypothetical protein
MNMNEQLAAIMEQFQSHRQTCEVCVSGSKLCSTGMAIAARIEETRISIECLERSRSCPSHLVAHVADFTPSDCRVGHRGCRCVSLGKENGPP